MVNSSDGTEEAQPGTGTVTAKIFQPGTGTVTVTQEPELLLRL